MLDTQTIELDGVYPFGEYQVNRHTGEVVRCTGKVIRHMFRGSSSWTLTVMTAGGEQKEVSRITGGGHLFGPPPTEMRDAYFPKRAARDFHKARVEHLAKK